MSPAWTAAEPERLDLFLVREGSFASRGQAQAAIGNGLVTVNGSCADKMSMRLRAGDRVELTGEVVREDDGLIAPIDCKLKVLFEDEACLVLDKPAGIAVHPGAGMEPGERTILHGVAFLFKKRKLPFSPDAVLVHRLDKDTTGCLLIAKTREAHAKLQKQFETRTVKKHYLALTLGVPSPTKAIIDAPIGRSTGDRTKMGVTRMSAPREAKTSYAVLSSSSLASLLVCELHTGRTHQIRVHLQAIGHPLLGDATYGTARSAEVNEEYGIESVCLHAWKLRFRSPADGEEHAVEAKTSRGFLGVMKKLGLACSW